MSDENPLGRAYVGIELPRSVRESLVGALREVERAGARCVSPRLLHLTLDDLGEVPAASLEAVQLAVEQVARKQTAFGLTIRGIEGWPADGPRLLRALATDDEGRLAALRGALHQVFERYGFPIEPGRWRPHVLLARLEAGADLSRFEASRELGAFKARRITLFGSGRRGYEPTWSIPLQRPGTAPEQVELTSVAVLTAELEARLAGRASQGQRPPRRRNRGRPNLGDEA